MNSEIEQIKTALQTNNLRLFYQRIELVKATAEQIKKDFEIFGEEITISQNTETAYRELKHQIVLIIRKVLHENPEKFLSLLYRIDLNEKNMREFLAGRRESEEYLAEMIIDRELIKVIYRKFYRAEQ